MFRKNRRSQQPLLISDVNELPMRSVKILKSSWAATFREEVFLRIQEERFAVLYATCPSRPNVPVNVLMGLEILKSGFGWSDEELYSHFLFDLQVRYALGCDNFGEGDFDLRTLYYFRQALSEYALKTGMNLVSLTFGDITDQQLKRFEVKTGIQRMDSTDIASNIADLSRLELLVMVLQRLDRMLSPADQARYQERLAPYLDKSAGQYTYRIKGKAGVWEHIQQVGIVLNELLEQLRGDYEHHAVYGVAQCFFEENFKRVAGQVCAKQNAEIQSGCLQSLDDLEASYRVKNNRAHKGYVANLSETADPTNPLQLVTQVSVAPNRTYDADLLKADVPAIQARMELRQLVNDGQYLGPEVDQVLRDAQVEQFASALTGKLEQHAEGELIVADFAMQLDPHGQVCQATCPAGYAAQLHPTRTGRSCRMDFPLELCSACTLQQQCPVRPNVKNTHFFLTVTQKQAAAAQRFRRFCQTKAQARALRTAIEATAFQLTHNMPHDKVPVRGRFRVTNVVLCSALALNARRIDRYLKDKQRGKFTQKKRRSVDSSAVLCFFQALGCSLSRPFTLLWSVAGC
jgi:hypothetical protein